MSSLRHSDTLRPLSAVLGSEAHRYFAAGYKQVRYGVDLASQELAAGGLVTVEVSADYPRHWSHDSVGAPREAHLSSVDAIALPLIALERLMGLSCVSRYWVQKVEIRAPRAPVTVLSEIPLELRVVGTPGITEELELTADVGGMRTSLQLRRSDNVDTVDVTAGELASVYSAGYRHVAIDTDLLGEEDLSQVLAHHCFTVDADQQPPVMGGVESAFSPSISIIDLLVTVGQMNQAAIYAPLPVTARRGELWLRSMAIEREQSPLPLPSALHSTTRILRDRLHVRGVERIHDLRTECVVENAATVRATLAYIEPRTSSQWDE